MKSRSKGSAAVVVLIIVIVVLVLGVGGVLLWGYANSKTDKAYATKAKTLVNDMENKYGGDKLENSIKGGSASAQIDRTIETLNSAKADAEKSLAELNNQKASSRVTTLKNDTNQYFNLIITNCNEMLTILSYSKVMVAVTDTLKNPPTISADTPAAAEASLTALKKSVDDAIAELNKASVPDEYKNFNTDFKAALEQFSRVLGNMITAAQAGDLELFTSYASQLDSISNQMSALNAPDAEMTLGKIITTDEQKQLDELPAKINTEADQILSKTFAF